MARKRTKKDTEKHLNLQCKQCAREQEAISPAQASEPWREEGYAEQELNGLEEGEDAMTDEEGEGVEGEGEGTADWRVRAGPRNKPTAREREEHEATHMPFPRMVHTL